GGAGRPRAKTTMTNGTAEIGLILNPPVRDTRIAWLGVCCLQYQRGTRRQVQFIIRCTSGADATLLMSARHRMRSIDPRTLVGQRQRQQGPRRAVRRGLWPGNMFRRGRGRRRRGKVGENAAGAIGLARALLFRRPAVSATTGGERGYDRDEQR